MAPHSARALLAQSWRHSQWRAPDTEAVLDDSGTASTRLIVSHRPFHPRPTHAFSAVDRELEAVAGAKAFAFPPVLFSTMKAAVRHSDANIITLTGSVRDKHSYLTP